MNKKGGVLGSTIVMIFAIISVVIILLIFAFGSQLVKWLDNSETGVSTINESDVLIGDVFVYIEEYGALSDARYSIEGGGLVDDALVKYEEDVVEVRRRAAEKNIKRYGGDGSSDEAIGYIQHGTG
jgi:hypothetical protein